MYVQMNMLCVYTYKGKHDIDIHINIYTNAPKHTNISDINILIQRQFVCDRF